MLQELLEGGVCWAEKQQGGEGDGEVNVAVPRTLSLFTAIKKKKKKNQNSQGIKKPCLITDRFYVPSLLFAFLGYAEALPSPVLLEERAATDTCGRREASLQ